MISVVKTTALTIYDRFIKIKGAPREIALGFALGLFIGMSPFFGLHIAISVVFASLFGWSKISAAIGVNITNVATAPFIYPVAYWLGAKITGFARHVQWPSSLSFGDFLALLKKSPLIILDLCVGGVILGIPIAFAGYYLALRAITIYRRRKRKPAGRLGRPAVAAQDLCESRSDSTVPVAESASHSRSGKWDGIAA